MSLAGVLAACVAFNQEVLDLEFKLRVVLRSSASVEAKLERGERLLEEAVRVCIAHVHVAIAEQREAMPAASALEAGQGVGMAKMVLANRVASLTLTRHLRARLQAGEASVEQVRVCIERTMGMVPFDLPMEQWVDASMPHSLRSGAEVDA